MTRRIRGVPRSIKALMVDVDGVLVVQPDGRKWTADLERDFGIPVATLQSAFFERHWNDVVLGRAALRDRLTPVLRDLAPQVTYEEFVAYWFSRDAHVDEALLGELAALRATGTEVHLATVQEHERARHLWGVLALRSRFDGLHYAADLGAAKPSPDFFRAVEARTGFAPRELFLIDDVAANVDSAIACGWSAARWTGHETLASILAAQPGSDR